MKKNIIINFFALLFCINVFSQQKVDFSALDIPKELSLGSNVILRDYKETFTIESISKATHKIYKVYTILNKDGEEYAQMAALRDKFHSIKTFEGKMYDAFGKQIDRLKKSEIKEEHYTSDLTLASDDYLKVGRFSRGEYPYTVEFTSEVVISSTMFYPFFQPQEEEGMSVEKASFEIIIPVNLKFRYKEVNISQKAKISPLPNNTTSYLWELNKIYVTKREKLSPPFIESQMAVITAPNDFEIDGYVGNMNTWQSFGKFINDLNAGRDELPTTTKDQIKNLTKKSVNKFEKIKIIYNYMQSKTRYVNIALGIGGWQPLYANVVDLKGYGDCKALSNYMKSLLKSIDIESYYTLVFAGENAPKVPKDFPSAYFNHATLCVPIDKDTIWLECTSQNQAPGYTSNFTDNRNVMIVTPTGGKLVKTPRHNQNDNLLNRSAQVNIDKDGNALVKSKTIYTGLQQDKGHMDHYAESSKDNQKNFLTETIELSHFEIESFNLERKRERIPKVIETLELKINGFGSKSGKRIFIAPNLMNKFEHSLPDNADRKSEIVLSAFDFIDVDTVKYILPADYHMEGVDNDIQFKTAFGEYSSTVKVEQGLMTYIRKLSMKGGRYPKEKYKELQDFFKNISKADKNKIVLVSST